jgi:hypothetical protein
MSDVGGKLVARVKTPAGLDLGGKPRQCHDIRIECFDHGGNPFFPVTTPNYCVEGFTP